MPGFDGRGPLGAGPMTGGGRGYCNPALYETGWGFFGRRAGLTGRGLGLRRGCRAGWGLGRGFWSAADWALRSRGPYYRQYDLTPQDEAEVLRRRAEFLRQDLEEVKSRLAELEGRQSQSQ